MRQWLEAGYFKGDLPISQNPNGSFRTLASLFPDISVAFRPTHDAKEEERAQMKARAEAEAKVEMERKIREEAAAAAAAAAAAEQARVEAAEAEAKAKAQAEAEAEAEAKMKLEAEASRQKSSVTTSPNNTLAPTNQNHSDQLKMLLGLGGGMANQNVQEDIIAGPPSPIAIEKATQKSNVDIQPAATDSKAPKSQPKSSKKSATTTTTTTSVPTPNVQPQQPTSQALTPAWGGAGTKNTGRKKTMSEIQQEEARVSARIAKERELTRGSSGGWANIAASGGTTAWSGGAVKTNSSPALIPSSVTGSSNSGTMSMQQARVAQQAQVNAAQKQAFASKQRTSTQKTMEEFGADGKMTPALESWCREQMRKLNGSDDLTLVAFCMTLTDSVEIRQYLTAYLGSTTQVNNFATEFISRKNGATASQEQWETTSSNKKGRKKKGVASK